MKILKLFYFLEVQGGQLRLVTIIYDSNMRGSGMDKYGYNSPS